jgi:hypothetical protein
VLECMLIQPERPISTIPISLNEKLSMREYVLGLSS